MTNTETPINRESSIIEREEKIENQKKIASNLMAAATHNTKAAYHLENGNDETYTQHAMLAKEYLNLATGVNTIKKDDIQINI